MTEIIGCKMNQLKKWLINKNEKTAVLKLAEFFFFMLPTLFLLHHSLLALLSKQDFYQLLSIKPAYTIQFISYLSYYFISLVLKILAKLVSNPKEKSLIKIVLLLIVISQLVMSNWLLAAVLLLVIRQLFQWQVFQINMSEVVISKQKWLLGLSLILVAISGLLTWLTSLTS